jgi:hypothetical protein
MDAEGSTFRTRFPKRASDTYVAASVVNTDVCNDGRLDEQVDVTNVVISPL